MCPHLPYIPAYIRVIIINNQFSRSSACTVSLWKPVQNGIFWFSLKPHERDWPNVMVYLFHRAQWELFPFTAEKSNRIELQIMAYFSAVPLVGKAWCWKFPSVANDLTCVTHIRVLTDTHTHTKKEGTQSDGTPAGAIVPLCPKITIKTSIKYHWGF